METSQDKEWASQYLLDPLNAPQPSEETGPGTSYNSTFPPGAAAKSSSQIEQEKRRAHIHTRSLDKDQTSPLTSSSPRRSHFPNAQESSSSHDERAPRESSDGRLSSEVATSSVNRLSSDMPESSARPSGEGRRPRGSSLTARFPGDQTHKPLDIIRKESKKAHRAPHLRKDRHIGADSIDRLAAIGGSYHHSGPYDPASLGRNWKRAEGPVDALSSTNEEALKATPQEKVLDSIRRHRPLDGVAMTAPGMPDPAGRILQYEEGSNMMIANGGNFKRWEGREYHPDDIKGKGEPSYSIEKALADHQKGHSRRRNVSDAEFELASRPRASSAGYGNTSDVPSGNRARAVSGSDGVPVGSTQSYAEWENELRRSEPNRGNKLISKMGSLRRRKPVGNES